MKATDQREALSNDLNHGRTLLTLSLGAFASQASVRLCDPMLPQLALEFNRSIGEVAYVITSFSIAYGLFQLIHGPMGDYAGKLRWIRDLTVVAAIASAACMLAGTLTQLVAMRFFAGAACAALIPLSLAWIGDAVPYQVRQEVLARLMTGSTAGAVFGQVAGGVMADTLGWRISFGLPAIVLAIVALLLSFWCGLPKKWSKNLPTTTTTTATLTTTTATLPEPLQSAQQPNPLVIERRGTRPSIRSIARQFAAVLNIAWARIVLSFVFIEGLLVYGAFAYVPSWLHLQFHLPLWQAGLAAAGFGVGGVIYSLGARYLIQKFGERGLLILGATVFSIGMYWIGGYWWPGQLIFCTMLGLGFFMVHNTLQVQATQLSPQTRGTAVAAFAVSLFSGQSIGVALASPIMSQFGFEALKIGSSLFFLLLGSGMAYLLTRKNQQENAC